MSNSESKNAEVPSGNDPRLKSFLRQARAVIAAERGLNRQSQLKLQSLAESMQLPDELFQLAIEELKHAQKPSEVAHWERAFVRFLDKEFKKLPRGIVTIAMESRAVDLALKKYQLSDIRARQLIAEQADALGLGLVSHGEAAQYVKQLISNRIGVATTIDNQVRQQLYQTGETWGLERHQVDEFVLDQLIRNRSIGRGRVFARLAFLGMLLVLSGAIVFAGYRFSWLEKLNEFLDGESNVVTVPESILIDPVDAPEVVVNVWWNNEIRAKVDGLKETYPAIRLALTRLEDPVVANRIDGFNELIGFLSQSDSNSPQIDKLFCELFYLEPEDRVCDAAVEQLAQLLKPDSLGGAINLARLQSGYRANSLMSLLRFSDRYDPDGRVVNRQKKVIDRVNKTLGLESESNNVQAHQRETESAVALEQWNYIVQTCWASPSRCALVIQPLYDLTKDRLDRTLLNQFRQRAIDSILDVDRNRWSEMTTAIQNAIEVADEIRVNDWIRLYRTVENREFGDFLLKLLATKTGIAASSNQRAETERRLFEIRLDYQNHLLQPVLTRNEAIEQLSTQAKNALKLQPNEVSPELIARTAFAANASLAVAIATHRNNDSFEVVDEIMAQDRPSLRQLVPLTEDRATKNGPAITTPSASENRQKNEAISKISDFRNMSTTSRQTTIEQLSRIAGRFEQISYKEAVVVADYLLSSMSIDEWLNVEKNMSAIKHWPNLALAIADRLPGSQVDLDQALTIYRLMFDDEFSLTKSTGWRTEIANQLYSSALSVLKRNAAIDFSAKKLDWQRLNIYLPRLHEQRFRLVREYLQDPNLPGYKANLSGNSNWNVQTLELLMFDRKSSRNDSERINRLLGLIRHYGRNELEKTILANQTLFEILSDRMVRQFPRRRLEIEKLRSDFHSSVSSSKLAGQRLQMTELAILQLWEILRIENLELLYTQS